MEPHPRNAQHQVSLWHEGFAECVRERAPADFQIISEFQLSLRPRRADLLVLRRTEHSDAPALRSEGKRAPERPRAPTLRQEGEPQQAPERPHDQGRILRALWPRLTRATIIEFKSPSRRFRHSDLIRLGSYGAQYHAERMDRYSLPDDLTLVLVVPGRSESLAADLDRMRWHLRDLDDGYAEVVGAWYTTFAVFTNQVAEAEQDDFLRIFSDLDVQTVEARYWLESWIIMKDTAQDIRDREGYDAMLEKLLRTVPPEQRLAGIPPEQRLAGIPPEQRLAGIPPEQRLAGIPPEQRLAGVPLEETLLALPDDILRGLSDEYIRSLPEPVQRAIRERLASSRSR